MRIRNHASQLSKSVKDKRLDRPMRLEQQKCNNSIISIYPLSPSPCLMLVFEKCLYSVQIVQYVMTIQLNLISLDKIFTNPTRTVYDF
jgi:hypothetical protein